MLLILLFIIFLITLYYSTKPNELTEYKKLARKRHEYEKSGGYFDWRSNVQLDVVPSPSPSPTVTTSPPKSTGTPSKSTGTPSKSTGTPSKSTGTPIPVTTDCASFIKAIGGLDGIVNCRNILHAKCRDNTSYKPANAAEQKCADYI